MTGKLIGLLLPSTVHLLALLIVLAVAAFRAARGSMLRRWRFALLFATAWTWFIATPVVAHALAFHLEARYPPLVLAGPPDGQVVIVVLASGESWEDATPAVRQLDLAGYRRTLTGVALWRDAGGTLIFSGATYPGEPQPVAMRMAKLATDEGVPRERTVVESQSLDTYQNLRNVAALLPANARIFLVTSALHMPRAVAVARALGLRVVPVPCDYRAKSRLTWRAWLPDGGALPLLALTIREWLGSLVYRLRGRT